MHNSVYQQSDLETDLHYAFGMRGYILNKLTNMHIDTTDLNIKDGSLTLKINDTNIDIVLALL